MLPTHFSNVLLSNWQAVVGKMARTPDPGTGNLGRPLVDYRHPRIAAACAAAYAAEQALEGKIVDLAGAAERHSKAALDLATALVSGAAKDIGAAREEFARFGTHDPFWIECVAEFVEHYAMTRHGAVPYVKWTRLDDFVLPSEVLPEHGRIAIISDWGTGDARAQALLEAVARDEPDIVIHLGDIYYACTASEANAFYENVTRVFGAAGPRLFTLCGNHDMYAGAGPYYALLGRLGQPASFFALRNAHWQILAADTGYNDFNAWTEGADATWLRHGDDGDPFSELEWHRDKFATADGRKTVFLTHHPLFTRNSSISGEATNALLLGQLGDRLPEMAAWVWGHEHNLVIYEPFRGLARGRCVGASAVPVGTQDDLDRVAPELEGQAVPSLATHGGVPIRLSPQARGGLYQLAYMRLDLDGADARATYVQFDPSTGRSTILYEEAL